jgi:hypothetical protein
MSVTGVFPVLYEVLDILEVSCKNSDAACGVRGGSIVVQEK